MKGVIYVDKEIRDLVRSEIFFILQELNASRPSCKISKGTSGKESYEVKVYGHDIVQCVNSARAATKFLAKKYFNEDQDDEQMPPIEAYDRDFPAAEPGDKAASSFDGVEGLEEDNLFLRDQEDEFE